MSFHTLPIFRRADEKAFRIVAQANDDQNHVADLNPKLIQLIKHQSDKTDLPDCGIGNGVTISKCCDNFDDLTLYFFGLSCK